MRHQKAVVFASILGLLSLVALPAIACGGGFCLASGLFGRSAEAKPAIVASAPVRSPKGEATQRFAIQGMFCADCARHIQANVSQLAGVKSVSVDYSSGLGMVTYLKGKVSPEQILKTIEKTGYKATLS